MFGRETRERALRLVDLGLSPSAASAAMGGSPSKRTIQDWRLARSDGREPGAGRVRLGPEEKASAARRVLSGEAVRAVANDVGASGKAVRGWARDAAARGEVAAVTEEDARERVRMRSAGGLPDDPEELKAMVLELRFQADLARELLEVVKKRPRRRPVGPLEQGEGGAGRRPEAGVFTDLPGLQGGDRAVDLPLPEGED